MRKTYEDFIHQVEAITDDVCDLHVDLIRGGFSEILTEERYRDVVAAVELLRNVTVSLDKGVTKAFPESE